MASSRLHELSDHGVSVWVDSLSREMLETGELARLIDEDAVVGVTSNPTIFEKALSTGDWYDDQLREELGTRCRPEGGRSSRSRSRTSSARAISCGRSGSARTGVDGFVSLEVDPELAYEREGTFEEAARSRSSSTARTSS